MSATALFPSTNSLRVALHGLVVICPMPSVHDPMSIATHGLRAFIAVLTDRLGLHSSGEDGKMNISFRAG